MDIGAADTTAFVGTNTNHDLNFIADNMVRMTLDTKGNVGIGTPSPEEKLTVAGTIESTSGGVKFPDGTVQTSASGVRWVIYGWRWH